MYNPKAISFTGTGSDRYRIVSTSNPVLNGYVFTFSCWFKMLASEDTDGLLFAGDDSTGNPLFVWVNTSGYINVKAVMSSGGSAINSIATAPDLRDGRWHHLLFSVDTRDTMYTYIDDVDRSDATPNLVGTAPIRHEVTTGWSIGAYHNSGDFPITGRVSDVYVNFDEYIDISVEANRRKFITAEKTPVYLGSTGQNPTGSQPFIYYTPGMDSAGTSKIENKGSATLEVNEGSIGDGTIIKGPFGNAGYDFNAISLNSTNPDAYEYSWGGAIAENGKVGTISFWLKNTIHTEVYSCILLFDGCRIYFTTATDILKIDLYDASNNSLLSESLSTPNWDDGEWHHYAASWDLVNDQLDWLLDGVHSSATGFVNADIDYDGPSQQLFKNYSSDAYYMDGAVADLWFDYSSYIDLSSTANQRKFFSSEGKPVFLGARGELPTGSIPYIYITEADNAYAYNRGSGIDFPAVATAIGGVDLTLRDEFFRRNEVIDL